MSDLGLPAHRDTEWSRRFPTPTPLHPQGECGLTLAPEILSTAVGSPPSDSETAAVLAGGIRVSTAAFSPVGRYGTTGETL